MKDLIRGQKIKLSDLMQSHDFQVGISIEGSSGQVFDISCFGVDSNNKLSDDRYFIFYNQKSSPCGSIVSKGVQSGDLETFYINLSTLPKTICRLVFTITIDGQGTMSQILGGHLRLLDKDKEIMRFMFSGKDFEDEKAIIVAEIYLKDVWRFSAVGQGFNGGLSALLKNFGGEEIAPEDTPSPLSENTQLKMSASVSLEKRIEKEAPQLVSLVKKAGISIKKAGLDGHRAKVALCLDISGSMSGLYSAGKIQIFAEKILALACKFDDDGSIDIFLFGANAHEAGEMSIGNVNGQINRIIKRYPLEGNTCYGKAIQMIRKFYFPDGMGREINSPIKSALPVYVMFITDGGTSDANITENQIKWASFEPIFWQFMAIGKTKKDIKGKGFFKSLQRAVTGDFAFLEQLDAMQGRYIDNANFFSVEDPLIISDDELYSLLMAEYPSWVKLAKTKGLLQ
ncbi:MAG: VWA domain-containing protein [Desulfobacterales bacterium]|nr:VWA domain-containing protein [Desulfobacterales bacterium]